MRRHHESGVFSWVGATELLLLRGDEKTAAMFRLWVEPRGAACEKFLVENLLVGESSHAHEKTPRKWCFCVFNTPQPRKIVQGHPVHTATVPRPKSSYPAYEFLAGIVFYTQGDLLFYIL